MSNRSNNDNSSTRSNNDNSSTIINLDEARKEKSMKNDTRNADKETIMKDIDDAQTTEAFRKAKYVEALERACEATTCWERTMMTFDLEHRRYGEGQWKELEYARSLAAYTVVARQLKCDTTWLSMENDGGNIINNRSRSKSAVIFLSILAYEYVRENPDVLLDDDATAPTFEELRNLKDFEGMERNYGRKWQWVTRYPKNLQLKIDEAFGYIKKHWLAILVIATELVRGHWFGPKMITRAMLHCLPEAINTHGDWLIFESKSFGLTENAYLLNEMENGSDYAYPADRLLIAMHEVGYTLDGTCENKH